MAPPCRPVNRRPHPTGVRHDAEAGTLGGLLYTDRSAATVPESQWVELVAAIAAGDTASLHALYERTHRIVFTLSMRISKDRETAEEITLDVFHDVWRHAGRYDPEQGTVAGWIMTQTRSRAIDRLRLDRRKKRTDPFPFAAAAAAEAGAADADEALHFAEQAVALRDALQCLTADERTAIEVAYFSELSYSETAERLAEPVGTVKTRIRSALGKLRKALASPNTKTNTKT
jgi:RNA polymerase sigma-70 factor, ECF subfamily